jgi:uncharacterized protein YgiM (DUF1202 family)
MKSRIYLANLIVVFTFLFLTGLIRPQETAAQTGPPVLAFYYAWFDQSTWSSGKAAGTPAEPYHSADPATIERQVIQAQRAGIDAFVQSWYGPQEASNQTETNFRILLDIAAARSFKAAVDFETTGPFFGDAGAVTGALATLLTTHVQHPAYLRYQGKPVIFFWRQQRFSVAEWAAIRNQVDPDHQTYWIAEGVDIAYQAVFDGHHLYSIAWAGSPADQLAKWGDRVRAYAEENQVERLWVATAMPGYDDTRQPRDNAFAMPRRNGDYLRESWQGALASQPDMLIITSFNEWLEGTQIEPSQGYGTQYLDVMRELVTALRGSPPRVPDVAPAAQEDPSAGDEPEDTPPEEPPPDGPYITVENLTNVRSGPAITFDRVGTLAAGSTAAVTGQTEAGDWWQIEFAGGTDGLGWVSTGVATFVGEPAAVPVVEAPAAPAIEETAAATADESEVTEATTPSTDGSVNPTTTGSASVRIPEGGVNMRSGPGLNFELLGQLDENTSARVVAKNETGEWWQIEYQAAENGLAWVAAVVVDFVGDPDQVPLFTAVATEEAAVPVTTATSLPAEPVVADSIEALDALNVRTDPSAEGARLGGLFLGETADVYAVSADGEWWQIEFADAPDGIGWIAAEFVRFQGDRAAVPIFGIGTPTPTPGPTNTPTPTRIPPTSTPLPRPATFAPTATSVFQATSAALLAGRGTPDPAVTALSSDRPSSFEWGQLPWGIISLLVVAAFLWYHFSRRQRNRSDRL